MGYRGDAPSNTRVGSASYIAPQRSRTRFHQETARYINTHTPFRFRGYDTARPAGKQTHRRTGKAAMTTGSEPTRDIPTRAASDIPAGQRTNPWGYRPRRRRGWTRFLVSVQAVGTIGYAWGAINGATIPPWEFYVSALTTWVWLAVYLIVKADAELWRGMYHDLSDWHQLVMSRPWDDTPRREEQ